MENNNNEPKRCSVSMTDLNKPKTEYISMKIGERAIVEIAKFEKVKVDPDFALAKQDFRYEITTPANKVLSIGAWPLLNSIKDAINTTGKTSPVGIVLEISHVEKGIYTATVVTK